MTFELITLFPMFFNCFFKSGKMARAVKRGVLDYRLVGTRKYGDGKFRKVDDTPYGGAEGMLIKKTVLENCLRECRAEYVVCLSPRGSTLNRDKTHELSQKKSLTIVCGHYEGVDQRFIDQHVDEEISIGDYILAGGETPALVLMEAVSRYIDGFLDNPFSHQNESFEEHGLEHDQYTKPFTRKVPEVLISGNHRKIADWKKENALSNTFKRRPDLLKKRKLTLEDEAVIKNYFYRCLMDPSVNTVLSS